MMRLDEIGLRDPYILLHEGKYYLYGTRNQTAWGAADGFDVYVSENLQDWEGPFVIFHNDGSFWATESYWAPECIVCQGKFYLIATFGAPNHSKGIQFLKADAPEGPFVPVGEGPVTPKGWNCIDGTFFQDEKGTPWLVFSHSVPRRQEEPYVPCDYRRI